LIDKMRRGGVSREMVRGRFRSVVDPAGPGEDLYGEAFGAEDENFDGLHTADESCP
jgi:hypothetical protein